MLWKIALLAAVVLGLVLALARRGSSRTEQLRASGLLPPEGAGTEEDVRRLIAAGRKIEAIKVYREIHGGGLKEAKEAVERIAGEMPGG